MKYIKGIEAYACEEPSVITIGKFDGLHLGHELLVKRVEELQQQENLVGIVLAFDMSPFFRKLNKETDFLLTNIEKAKLLENRIEYFVDCPFDETLSSMEAEDFIKQIILKKFHAKYVVVGNDFRFGHQKRGDCHMLQKYGEKYGYSVEVYDKKCYNGREISSTYIKEELKNGNVELVNVLLGRISNK